MTEQIEPITIEEIRSIVAHCDLNDEKNIIVRIYGRLILAWAHERAIRNQSVFHLDHSGCVADDCEFKDCHRHQYRWEDWLNEVLGEIGWPKGER